ncbi:MAG TPA: universal stress protein [Pseudonocardiaceae bacterium]
MTTQPEPVGGPIIAVGVDDSPAGRAALTWAVHEASQRNGTVRAISVSARPELMPATSYALQPHGLRQPEHDDVERAVWLRGLIDAARAGIENPPHVTAILMTGDPETELTNAARGADLLVVGGHGQGPLAELFLGSVAAGSVRHAHCPVVIIPHEVAQTAGAELR